MVRLLLICGVFLGVSSKIQSVTHDTRSGIIAGEITGNIVKQNRNLEVLNNAEFPYMAFVEKYNKFVCGATIIRLDMVLTAGHCVMGAVLPSNLKIRAGTFIREDKSGIHVQLKEVTKFQKHPLYRVAHNFIDYDIAVIKLTTPFLMTKYIKPINLPKESHKEDYIGEEAVVIGIGETEDTLLPANLRKATVKIISRKSCQSMFTHLKVLDTHICTIAKNGISSPCKGDSGGPLVKHNHKHPEEDILLGITSFGTPQNEPLKINCFTNLPAAYTYVANLRNWIDYRLKKL